MVSFSLPYAFLFIANVVVASWVVLNYVEEPFFQTLFFVILSGSVAVGLILSCLLKREKS